MFSRLILGLLFCITVLAQPVKMIVPFSPGGQVDVITREAEKIVTQELNRPVIVEYRLGAGSSIGITSVARNKTSEVNLMFIDTNALANVIVSNNVSIQDFKFLGLLGTTSTALAVVKGSVFRDLKYWLTVKRPINVGTNGVGSPHHFYTYSLGRSMGIELEAIPYKGIAPAMNDLINGNIDAMWGSVPTLLPYEQAGKIEMIANMNPKRLPYAPNMPTFSELGYQNVGAPTHWIIVSNTTADETITKEIAQIFNSLPPDHTLYKNTHMIQEHGQSEIYIKERLKQQAEFAKHINRNK